LRDLSFSIPTGGVAAFIGNNGAGKTTTFSLVAGYLKLRRGAIEIFDQPLRQFLRNGGFVGVLPQDADFYDDVPIAKQLSFLAALIGFRGVQLRDEVARVLEVVGLSERAKSAPEALSRGMKMRLGIAQAVLGRPKLLLLDEPTAGLDPAMQVQFRDLIDSIKSDTTIVISSHDLSGLEQICSYVCYIDSGRLVRQEPLQTLQREVGKVVFVLGREFSTGEVLPVNIDGVLMRVQVPNQIQVEFNPNEMTLSEVNRRVLHQLLEKNIPVIAIHPESSLERLFRSRSEGVVVP
jgi:ABC-type multidrug transport system ATPase subunit